MNNSKDETPSGATPSETSLSPELPSPEVEVPPAAAPLDEWDTVRRVALRHLDRFMSLEPKVLRGDDPDAIHDMRVASRRLQEVVDLLNPPPPPKPIRSLRRKIRRCRRALSEVRNCDVLIRHIDSHLSSKRATRLETWTAVKHYLFERRSESFERALGKLSKVNLAVFYVHLKGHLASDGAGRTPLQLHEPHGSANQPERRQFYERVSESLEKVARAFETQVAQSRNDARSPVIHGTRIAAKRLRYLMEVIQEFNVPGTGDILAWLRQLQQHLGEWHDLEVLEQMMIEMVARPEFLREHLDLAMGVEKLIVRNRASKKNYEKNYFRMIEDSEGCRRLKEWVSHLLSSPSAAFAKA